MASYQKLIKTEKWDPLSETASPDVEKVEEGTVYQESSEKWEPVPEETASPGVEKVEEGTNHQESSEKWEPSVPEPAPFDVEKVEEGTNHQKSSVTASSRIDDQQLIYIDRLPSIIKKKIEGFDENRDGLIDIDELVHAAQSQARLEMEKKLFRNALVAIGIMLIVMIFVVSGMFYVIIQDAKDTRIQDTSLLTKGNDPVAININKVKITLASLAYMPEEIPAKITNLKLRGEDDTVYYRMTKSVNILSKNEVFLETTNGDTISWDLDIDGGRDIYVRLADGTEWSRPASCEECTATSVIMNDDILQALNDFHEAIGLYKGPDGRRLEEQCESESNSNVDIYDAVIVGAGWSGIRAAEILSQDEGISKVLIIEANDYIGGRARTVMNSNISGIPTDFGCEWLYTEWNQLEPTLRNAGYLDNVQNEMYSTAGAATYIQARNESTEELTAELMDEKDVNELEGNWKLFTKFRKNLLKRNPDLSYGEAMRQFMDMSIDDNEDRQYLNSILDLGELGYGGDINDLSLNEVGFSFMLGSVYKTHYMSVPSIGGFGTVASRVANDTISSNADTEIKLESTVKKISEAGNNVVVSYEQDGEMYNVTTRAALVTVSLGVLKARHIEFDPSLPDRKLDTIDGMGFGLLNKCIMYWDSFSDMVWPEDTYWLEVITPDDDDSGLFTAFFNPTTLKGKPCLIAWVAGDEAVNMEEKTDDFILDQVMKNLKSMYPTINDPTTVMITRWGQEVNFLGSYSFNQVDRNFFNDASKLKEKFGNIWFSGEATNTEGWFGTTVGAWNTGEEAGRSMAESIKDRKPKSWRM